MSTIKTPHIFTSESVSEGHPDKVCDQISDAILDECLKQDANSFVACETLATSNLIVLAGEITSKAKVPWANVVRQVVKDIGYDDPALGFDGDSAQVLVAIHKQAENIAHGVGADTNAHHEQGAGDQGLMFGYACNETDQFMPAPIYYAHKIMSRFSEMRQEINKMPHAMRYLKPDAKAQISFRYEDGKPVAITDIVVSHQHAESFPLKDLEVLVHDVINEVIPKQYLTKDTRYFINPAGLFNQGGPAADTGLTGRKIIVDTYGGMGRHGGGAFSGKDPSKVDRSGAYMARYAVKNIVAAGLADVCELQVSYAIGYYEPIAINVNTFGTGKVADEKLAKFIMTSGLFDFRPASIIQNLKLTTPEGWCYRQTAQHGHFGNDIFPWEKLDKVDALKNAFN